MRSSNAATGSPTDVLHAVAIAVKGLRDGPDAPIGSLSSFARWSRWRSASPSCGTAAAGSRAWARPWDG
jgi:hypothetical protein